MISDQMVHNISQEIRKSFNIDFRKQKISIKGIIGVLIYVGFSIRDIVESKNF